MRSLVDVVREEDAQDTCDMLHDMSGRARSAHPFMISMLGQESARNPFGMRKGRIDNDSGF